MIGFTLQPSQLTVTTFYLFFLSLDRFCIESYVTLNCIHFQTGKTRIKRTSVKASYIKTYGLKINYRVVFCFFPALKSYRHPYDGLVRKKKCEYCESRKRELYIGEKLLFVFFSLSLSLFLSSSLFFSLTLLLFVRATGIPISNLSILYFPDFCRQYKSTKECVDV